MMNQLIANPYALSNLFANKKIHLGICGSVACYKLCDVLRAWLRLHIHVSATLSPGAGKFLSPLLFRSLGAAPVYGEMFEDDDVFAHLEPGRCVDAMIIAPASANALSRMAAGAASDMLSAQALAFSGPLVIAPAMNPRMYAHPATQKNLEILAERGALIVGPDKGEMACGDDGRGRLATQTEIFLWALRALSPQDMAGLNVLVTLGPTREPWDGVRFLSNPSSGRMGGALATCAWLRGAHVTAICGPGIDIALPRGIDRVNVGSAAEMFAAANKFWPEADLGLFCAAVSDFAPVRPEAGDDIKIKKSSGIPRIDLAANPDILATLSANRRAGQRVLGFAAEVAPDMRALLPLAREKLARKRADMIAANRVNKGQGSFGADTGSMAVVDKNGAEEIWSPQNKADIAWELCSWLLKI